MPLVSRQDAGPREAESRRRALVVDDDGGVQRVMSRALAMHGLQVEEARDGEDGLRRALAVRYRVVLLDLELPKLDGMTVLRQLRTLRPEQAVVICSCQSDNRTRTECLRAGAQGFLAKPFSLGELASLVGVARPGVVS
jgi:DNA-binding response OmpR family regulator